MLVKFLNWGIRLGTTLLKLFLTNTVTAVPVVGGDGEDVMVTVALLIDGNEFTAEITELESHGVVTAAFRAPSRAAFVALFFWYRYRPNSVMPKTNNNKIGRTSANSTRA